ncbi:hypothetical protein [Bradyrhizobium sp. SZCCHNS1054]|uniref:hypothetical protein n=1 Tax=Bradyrhizobium sp. SZCCHNS1054 TaxID=3057301 RepID=UPI002916E50A|nr:hypothetical protein [Bradyrhizobium sp. SZCCHNS1054]
MGALRLIGRFSRFLLSPWDERILSILLGSRLTLIANICAAALVPVITQEGAYIVHACTGYDRPQDVLMYSLPVIVMLLVRRQALSFCFLIIYVAICIQMYFQAESITLGVHTCGDRLGDPIEYMPFFSYFSMVCLAGYIVYLAVVALVAVVKSIVFVAKDER